VPKVGVDAYRQIGIQVARLQLPTVIVQEGGYNINVIGQALENFLRGLAEA
jgi:acetoin utilization deacetylase AcuC-like enzyme